jgi:hypothetical protein
MMSDDLYLFNFIQLRIVVLSILIILDLKYISYQDRIF